jgi:hypothetical protein
MNTYRITYLAGKLDATYCPPDIVKVIFPLFNLESVNLTEQYCDVTFSEPQTPVDISPLIKVELVTEESN